MLRLYTALPWLWIAVGLLICALLGEGISALAHAPGGPDMGGAFLLIAFLAMLFPLGLAFVFVGFVLLAGGRLFALVMSVVAIGLCATAVLAVPPAVMFLAPIVAVPGVTVWALRSDEVLVRLAQREAEQAARLQRIASGADTPPLARWISLAWRTAGALVLLGLPAAAVFPASDGRDLFVLYEVLSLPLGVALFVVGRRLEKPQRSTLRWGRVWAVALLLSTGLLGLSAGLKPASAAAFFAVVSFWTLGRPELRALADRGGGAVIANSQPSRL